MSKITNRSYHWNTPHPWGSGSCQNSASSGRSTESDNPIPQRYTIAQRRAWLDGASAQISGQPRTTNPYEQQDGDLAEVLAEAWSRGWDDTAAVDMSPVREIAGGEGGGA